MLYIYEETIRTRQSRINRFTYNNAYFLLHYLFIGIRILKYLTK